MEEKEALKVSNISILINVVLSALKLLAGIVAKSSAMISDAIHSVSDVFSTVIVIIGVKLSSKQSDKTHPYGHERFECVASIILSVILIITGISIGITGIKNIATRKLQRIWNTRSYRINCSCSFNRKFYWNTWSKIWLFSFGFSCKYYNSYIYNKSRFRYFYRYN